MNLLCCEFTWILTPYFLENTIEVIGSVISNFISYLCHRLVTISKKLYSSRYTLVINIRGISDVRT